MNGKGFIKVPRALLNEWLNDLPLDESMMLIHLMALANYEDKPKKAPKGDYILRGQLVTSVRSLATTFRISPSRMMRLLIKWEKRGYIKRETKSGTDSGTPSGTLLTLEFYAFSQGVRNSKRNDLRNKNAQTTRSIRKDNPSPARTLNEPDGEASKKVIYTR